MLALTFRSLNPVIFNGQIRQMATLKDISIRLKSIKNIQKITKSMKMVSAAKYNKAERDLRQTRPYGQGSQQFYEKANTLAGLSSDPQHLIIAMTSDRGLCGAANSSIIKTIRNYMWAHPEEVPRIKLVTVGDKARASLSKQFPANMLFQITDVGKKVASFDDASFVAMGIIDSGFKFDKASMYYNKFKSVISYETLLQPLYSLETVTKSEKINLYDSIDDDVLKSYNEFLLASLIYYAFKENATSEQSARMTAMDSASKNAGEIITRLTLLYNRTRQAAITRELVEIISGAAALE